MHFKQYIIIHNNTAMWGFITTCNIKQKYIQYPYLLEISSSAEGKISPGTLSVSCSNERLLEKNGLSEGLGVEEMLIVSISGPESLRSSSSSNRSSISVGSTSPPEKTQRTILFSSILNALAWHYKCKYLLIIWDVHFETEALIQISFASTFHFHNS